VAHDTEMEERLRELLTDPGWSLPSWPDPQHRVRIAARRQRIRAASAAATATAVTAAVVIATLSGFRSGPVRPGSTDARSVGYALPAVGAAGFPASIYPAAFREPALGRIGWCPNLSGLERPPASMRAQTMAVVGQLGSGFRPDLRRTDRAYWPQVQSGWRSGAPPASAAAPVLYSGPLESPRTAPESAELSRAVRISCGSRTATDTWLVMTGSRGKVGHPSEYLLLDRRGHLLVWNAE